MSVKDLLLFLLINLIWGTAFAFTGISMLYFTPFFFLSIRFIFFSLISIPFTEFPKKNFLKILFLSLIQTFCFIFMSLGVKHINSSTTSVLINLDIIFTILLSHIFLDEELNINTVIGILFSFIGTIFVYKDINISNIIYFILVIISAFLSSIYNFYIKKIQNSSNQQITSWYSLLTGLELLIISLINEKAFILKSIDFKIISIFLYLTLFSTYISYYILNYLLKKYQASKIMPYKFLRTIISLFAGYFLLNESVTILKLIGTLIILLGVFISQIKIFKFNKGE